MALRSGQRIGRYEVVALLDGGGQGEVYRARDTRLSRDVALKVLSDERPAERHRVRFEREAQALAALNHPNIAALVGVEESPDSFAIVMELIEGESLAARLAAAGGRGIPSEALAIARQISDALQAAHERGLVHRDLKPANVMIRSDGAVKLVDFGLAKSLSERGGDPTASTVTVTGTAGAVIGTAAYMSPEQARGGTIDRRTDVWAFGCVLYEMLTGRRAFDGATTSDAIASVLTREPDLSALPTDVDGSIRRLLRRCFVKEPRNRLHDIGDAKLEIEDALGPARRDETSAPLTTAAGARRTGLGYVALALASAAIGGVAVWAVSPAHQAPRLPVTRSSFIFPAAAPFTSALFRQNIAITPDGTRVLYNTLRGFAIRPRDRFEVAVVSDVGTFPSNPFFSPDGAWIGYFDGGVLKRVATGGGQSTRITEVGPGATGSWGDDGIVVADVWGLFRISADGRAKDKLAIANIGAGEQVTDPYVLPDGRGVLFTVMPTRTIAIGLGRAATSRVEVLDFRTGRQRTLVYGGGRAAYVPTGHLLYSQGTDATLAAAPFDLTTLGLSGNPVSLDIPGDSEFAVSNEGVLIYATGTTPLPKTLVWVDRQGREEPLGAPARRYLYPRLSPDGRRVALDMMGPGDRDIWIWDLHRKVLERFTMDPAANPLPAWSPDGTRLAFGSDRFGPTNLFWQAADGSGEPERLLESTHLQQPTTFTPDGRLLFSEDVPGEGRNIQALDLATRRVEPLIRTPANELTPEISPNGRWVAYDSNESGQFEIYVRPYPNVGGGRWQISAGGGRQPLWSHDGRELYYRDFSGAVMGAQIAPGARFSSAAATKILDGGDYIGGGAFGSSRTYDVGRDGRFLMIKLMPQEAGSVPAMVIVQNWFEELKRLAPAR